MIELAERDQILGAVMRSYPGAGLQSRGDPFSTLVRSIVGQQISVKASESVWQKLLAAIDDFSPAAVLGMPPSALRACGLSERKVVYIQDLAAHFASARLDPSRWHRMDDEAIIAALCEVRGIGRWTAEMFLIFNLLRPDVLPLDDLGLQRAMANHYGNSGPLSREEMRALGARWQPWRTVATWYLWRSLDPVPVEY